MLCVQLTSVHWQCNRQWIVSNDFIGFHGGKPPSVFCIIELTKLVPYAPFCRPSSVCELLIQACAQVYIHAVLNDSNSVGACIGQLALQSAKSPLGSNIAFLRYEFDVGLIQH